ncbi:MAG: hypothetical protein ACYDEY_14095 [Acidimicrobiales bacterium]
MRPLSFGFAAESSIDRAVHRAALGMPYAVALLKDVSGSGVAPTDLTGRSERGGERDQRRPSRGDPRMSCHLAVLEDRQPAEVAWTSRPIERILAPLVIVCETAGRTTTTDTCSQHNRASRRGGKLELRARSP